MGELWCKHGWTGIWQCSWPRELQSDKNDFKTNMTRTYWSKWFESRRWNKVAAIATEKKEGLGDVYKVTIIIICDDHCIWWSSSAMFMVITISVIIFFFLILSHFTDEGVLWLLLVLLLWHWEGPGWLKGKIFSAPSNDDSDLYLDHPKVRLEQPESGLTEFWSGDLLPTGAAPKNDP